MVDIRRTNPTLGVNMTGTKAAAVRQAVDSGRSTTPQFASQVSQAVTPIAGEQLQKAFQDYESSQQQQQALRQAQTQTSAMKEMLGRQQETFDLGLDTQRRLSVLDNAAKNEMLDSELTFKKDSANQKYLSERQILDWSIAKGMREEDYKTFELNLTNAYNRKKMLMEAVANRAQMLEKQSATKDLAQISQEMSKTIAGMDRETQLKMKNMQIDLEKEVQQINKVSRLEIAEAARNARAEQNRLSNKAANTSALISGMSGLGMVVGGALGTVIFPGLGTAAGTAAGAATFGAIGAGLGAIGGNNIKF